MLAKLKIICRKLYVKKVQDSLQVAGWGRRKVAGQTVSEPQIGTLITTFCLQRYFELLGKYFCGLEIKARPAVECSRCYVMQILNPELV